MLYECSQDQWDIYKLDPLYECRVRAPPASSTIISVSAKSPESPQSNGKRTSSKAGIPPLNPRKKLHTGSGNSSLDLGYDDDEVEEVEDMIVDQTMPPPPRARSASLRRKREEISQIRQHRRENISRRAEKLSSREDELNFNFSTEDSPGRSQSVPVDNGGKRKGTLLCVF